MDGVSQWDAIPEAYKQQPPLPPSTLHPSSSHLLHLTTKTLKRKRSSADLEELGIGRGRFSSTPSPTSTEASSFLTLPSPPSTVLPLTEENLYLLEGAKMPQNAPSQLTPKSKSSAATKSTLDSAKPKKASDVRTVLELNSMFINDMEAYKRYPAVAESVKAIMGHRESTMKPEQVEELARIRGDFECSTETTFLVNFMTKLIAGKRLVKSAELSEPSDDDKQYIERSWSAERLRTTWLAPFRKEALPALNTANYDKALKELLDKSPRVTNPTPDMTFGLCQDAFTATDRIVNKYFACVEACPQSLHSWFLVECKTTGSVVDAINQACRGGAALVFTRRHFNAIPATKDISVKDVPRQTNLSHDEQQQEEPKMADLNSVAFSMVLTPHIANIYVHWAEIQGSSIRYHMNLVQDRSISSPIGTGLGELRRDVDNILDWGTLGRKRDIQGVLKMIRRNAAGVDEEEGDGDVGADSERQSELGDSQSTAKRARHS